VRINRGWWRRIRLRPRAVVWLAPLLALSMGGPVRGIEVVAAVGEHGVIKDSVESPIEGGFTLRFTGAEMWRSKRGVVLVPSLGALTTEEGAYYGWAGAALFVPLGSRWGLVPEVGAGVYEQGDGRNLGGSLEFRSGLEVTYRANDAVRVGVGLYHLSNAGIHDINPGVNSFVLTFGIRPKSRSQVWDTAGLR
jgi:hypothetical protein